MLGIHRWLRVGLLIIVAAVLGACTSRLRQISPVRKRVSNSQ